MVNKCSPDAGAVPWQRTQGQWVLLQALSVSSLRATLLRVAEGLRDQQQTAEPAFTIAEAPDGSVLRSFDSNSVQLGPPGPKAPLVTVSVTNPGSNNDIGDDTVDAKKVKVGELSGWSQKKDGILRMTLRVSDGIWLSVHAPDKDSWNEGRLTRFAEGVEYVGPRPLEN